jgi:hypothetical protein
VEEARPAGRIEMGRTRGFGVIAAKSEKLQQFTAP